MLEVDRDDIGVCSEVVDDDDVEIGFRFTGLSAESALFPRKLFLLTEDSRTTLASSSSKELDERTAPFPLVRGAPYFSAVGVGVVM